MALTELENVVSAISETWPSLFVEELKSQHPLVSLIDRSYDAEFGQGNDRAHINSYDVKTGQLLTISRTAASDDACSFVPVAQTLSTVDLIIDKRAVSSREFCDTVELLSKVNPNDDMLRQTMAYEVAEQINNHLYTIVPAAEDVVAATMTAATLTELGRIADVANLPMMNRWLLVSPGYYQDLLNAQTLVSVDSVGSADRPQIGGRFVQQRFGWNIVMDNSAGMNAASRVSGEKIAIAFVPDFAYWASPRSQFKISDTHSALKFGTVMSADTVFGAALGIAGATKVIKVAQTVTP